MLNKFKSVYENKLNTAIFTLATLISLNGCSSGGGEKSDNNINSKEVIKVKIQAGTIVGANVEIKTLSGVSLINYKTNENGEIFIDKELINSKLADLGLSDDEPLEFISSGGVDIDPDDDGNIYNDTDQNLTGKMSGVSSLSEINNGYINPLSSLVNDILNNSLAIQQEVEKFYTEISSLKQEIINAKENLISLEQPEYWGGYLNGYLDVLIAEGVTMTIATKNAAKVINILKNSNSYLIIKKITARINVAGEIYKSTFKTIDLNRLANTIDEFGKIYGTKSEQITKLSFIIAIEKGINEKILIHLIYGEWDINGKLKSGLHSMNAVEELLKDGKIDIKYLSGTKIVGDGKIENIFSTVNYDEYIALPENLKKTVKIAPKGTNNFSVVKSLFPKSWTDEDIAEAIKKAEENIKDILVNEYKLPLYSKENASKYWKETSKKGNIFLDIEIKGKRIKLDLGGKYDNKGNLDFNIITLYPTN